MTTGVIVNLRLEQSGPRHDTWTNQKATRHLANRYHRDAMWLFGSGLIELLGMARRTEFGILLSRLVTV